VQPRVRIRGGAPQRLDTALGDDFAVLARERADKLLAAPARAGLERIGARWLCADEWQDLDGWLDAQLARHLALVVRPDRYLLGAADDAPALERLLRGLADALA